MKTHWFKIPLFISLIFLATACQKTEWLSEGEYFFLKSEGAVMPVWVQGNILSGTFIITNHGGPLRNTGHDFRIFDGFKNLEKEYAIVYWDQRLSGMSQGDPKIASLSVDQNIEDLANLVELIRHKYNPKSLFLLGHSWGGTLTGGYLGRNNHQEYFNGWIDVDGSIQDEFEAEAKKEWIFERLPEAMADSDDPAFWQYIIDWYETNPHPVETDQVPYIYVGALGGDVYDYEAVQQTQPIPYKDLVFSSPFSFSFYWSQHFSVEDLAWINGYDVTEEVSKIRIPALLIWGEGDGVVPPSVAQLAYDLLQTHPDDKEIVLLEKCCHAPFSERPEAFYQEVRRFVEQYK